MCGNMCPNVVTDHISCYPGILTFNLSVNNGNLNSQNPCEYLKILKFEKIIFMIIILYDFENSHI